MATTTPTPYELGTDGKPLTWVGATDAPGMPGDPTRISVAIATQNYPGDETTAPPFTAAFPAAFVPLLQAAEDVWEGLANIQFINAPDTATNPVQAADIRVGVANLASLRPPSMGTILGFTHYSATANDKNLPDTRVTVENPAEQAVTALPDGDFRYNGFTTTVFQDLLHELGHALDLAHNLNDPGSIMNPVLTANNPLPDANDVAALQAAYGPAVPGRISLSQTEVSTLNHLIPGLNLA